MGLDGGEERVTGAARRVHLGAHVLVREVEIGGLLRCVPGLGGLDQRRPQGLGGVLGLGTERGGAFDVVGHPGECDLGLVGPLGRTGDQGDDLLELGGTSSFCCTSCRLPGGLHRSLGGGEGALGELVLGFDGGQGLLDLGRIGDQCGELGGLVCGGTGRPSCVLGPFPRCCGLVIERGGVDAIDQALGALGELVCQARELERPGNRSFPAGPGLSRGLGAATRRGDRLVEGGSSTSGVVESVANGLHARLGRRRFHRCRDGCEGSRHGIEGIASRTRQRSIGPRLLEGGPNLGELCVHALVESVSLGSDVRRPGTELSLRLCGGLGHRACGSFGVSSRLLGLVRGAGRSRGGLGAFLGCGLHIHRIVGFVGQLGGGLGFLPSGPDLFDQRPHPFEVGPHAVVTLGLDCSLGTLAGVFGTSQRLGTRGDMSDRGCAAALDPLGAGRSGGDDRLGGGKQMLRGLAGCVERVSGVPGTGTSRGETLSRRLGRLCSRHSGDRVPSGVQHGADRVHCRVQGLLRIGDVVGRDLELGQSGDGLVAKAGGLLRKVGHLVDGGLCGAGGLLDRRGRISSGLDVVERRPQCVEQCRQLIGCFFGLGGSRGRELCGLGSLGARCRVGSQARCLGRLLCGGRDPTGGILERSEGICDSVGQLAGLLDRGLGGGPSAGDEALGRFDRLLGSSLGGCQRFGLGGGSPLSLGRSGRVGGLDGLGNCSCGGFCLVGEGRGRDGGRPDCLGVSLRGECGGGFVLGLDDGEGLSCVVGCGGDGVVLASLDVEGGDSLSGGLDGLGDPLTGLVQGVGRSRDGLGLCLGGRDSGCRPLHGGTE